MCPTVEFKMSSAILPTAVPAEKTLWEGIVSVKDNSITIQNYSAINVTEWNGLLFNMRSRSKNNISIEHQVFKTNATNFKCSTDKILAYSTDMV